MTGQHYSEGTYEPLTAGRPSQVDSQSGAAFPVVGVQIVLSPADGDVVPFVTLHITGAGTDLDVDLRLHEAREVAQHLQHHADVLAGTLERA